MTTKEVLDKIEERLEIIMEGDTRTFTNQITEDGKYYEGIYEALKIVKEYERMVDNEEKK